jgi:Mn-dependent DtxR family transcriptional regulator
VLRNHRLWEMYLIKYADIAPSHVDRDADEIEHVLSGELIRELELALEQEPRIPPSPHLEVAT